MPKPGKYNNKPSWKTQYNDTEYRGGGDTRRVSFKSNRYVKKDNKDWTSSVRAHLQDEDFDMGGSAVGRSTFKKGFRGRRGSGRSDSPVPNYKRKFIEGAGWFKISLPFGKKYEKEFLVRMLTQKIEPLVLCPLSWKVQDVGNGVSFYIDDMKVAEKLLDLNRQIQLPDGFQLIVRVDCLPPPRVDVTPELKEKIKLTMAKRYNAATKALDLTKFHADPDLQDDFCALCKYPVIEAVIEIMVDNIPETEAINFFDNKLTHLSNFKKINSKLPRLKILHFGNNKIKEASDLDPLIGLPIVDLVLNGNPICGKFKDQELYIGEVRKRFPKVMKLDGVDLPPPISFDLAEETTLPPSRQTFLCNPEGESIVRQFLEQYFLIFDSENRQPLIQAYHESAVFSMTMSYPYGQKDRNAAWLNWYTTDNRNIIRVTNPERRSKLLKQGQVAVVSFLQEMPLSKHDIHSFTVDLVLFTPQMIVLTITGIFKELKSGHRVPPIRHFFRTLTIVPAGPGFCIVNESLHITNATEEQVKNAFKAPVVAAPSTPIASPVVSAVTSPIPDAITKNQMVQALADQSGMNLEWSGKCLQETQWDFARAVAVFADLHKQGVVPPEAFVK